MSGTFRVTNVSPSNAADTAISESTDGFFKPFEAIAKPRTVAASATSVGQRGTCYRASRGGRDGTVEGCAITSEVKGKEK